MIEVEKIDFSLPDIAEFNIPDGLDAVRDALRRAWQTNRLSQLLFS
jgi:hypothetical protein